MVQPFGQETDHALICKALKLSWGFLSGQDRTFVPLTPLSPPQYLEQAYYIHIEVVDDTRAYVVSVLLPRADARDVASHMFGTDDLKEGDLQDACGEVCNVFANRELLQLGESALINMGKTGYLLKETYEKTCSEGRLINGYVGIFEERHAYVLVFEVSAAGATSSK